MRVSGTNFNTNSLFLTEGVGTVSYLEMPFFATTIFTFWFLLCFSFDSKRVVIKVDLWLCT